ncbi:S41 family peptidase [Fluviispira vulneris]|uniref:S41 family peptidase n=1 Tax=Fluviispira vulneris TaxID=2763012 RepID=UPI001644E20A|nr:S41 family peptidase [Fluviispira vulneris]
MKKLILCSSLILLSACGKKNNEFDVNSVITNPDHGKVINTVAYMFDNYYVHDKGGNSAADIRKVNNSFGKEMFYNKIEEVFFKQKDAHTVFYKPSKCFSKGVHPNNLSLELAEENGQKKIVVASLNTTMHSVKNFGDKDFINYILSLSQLRVGDVITEINGVNVLQALNKIKTITYGANSNAEELRSLNYLMYRNGAIHEFPSEDQFVLSLERGGRKIRIPSHSFIDPNCNRDEKGIRLQSDFTDDELPSKPSLNFLKKGYNPILDNDIVKKYSNIEKFENIAYFKISTFDLDINDDDKAREEENRILYGLDTKLSQIDLDTIVIDLRNNGGGSIRFADNLARLFYDKDSKYPFYPMEFRLKNTKGNLELVNKFLAYERNVLLDFASEYAFWKQDLEDAAQNGWQYTKPRALTQDYEINKVYRSRFTKLNNKKIIILTNAKCFSACDQFVAIMKDQNLATKIVGENKFTAGGGANVISWELLVEKNFVERLPGNTEMTFSWRDMQSRIHNGTAHRAIEGNGTQADCVIPKTIEEIKEKTDSLNSKYIQKVISAVKENKC